MKFDWPHAPLHRLGAPGAYMVTCGTHFKKHHFSNEEKLQALCGGLLKYAKKYQWQLQAWAVFSNHYHFIGMSPQEGAENLPDFINHFHSRSSAWVNRQDNSPGRKVWHNYRESHLTFQTSYFARLNYVHHNAVKHGIAKVASDYSWCSAGWFERKAPTSFVKTIYSHKTDDLNIEDDFGRPWSADA